MYGVDDSVENIYNKHDTLTRRTGSCWPMRWAMAGAAEGEHHQIVAAAAAGWYRPMRWQAMVVGQEDAVEGVPVGLAEPCHRASIQIGGSGSAV
jgi:hypothetical protein